MHSPNPSSRRRLRTRRHVSSSVLQAQPLTGRPRNTRLQSLELLQKRKEALESAVKEKVRGRKTVSDLRAAQDAKVARLAKREAASLAEEIARLARSKKTEAKAAKRLRQKTKRIKRISAVVDQVGEHRLSPTLLHSSQAMTRQ